MEQFTVIGDTMEVDLTYQGYIEQCELEYEKDMPYEKKLRYQLNRERRRLDGRFSLCELVDITPEGVGIVHVIKNPQ